MTRLDPTLDFVFKRLFTRNPMLLVDMLEGVLGRTIRTLEFIESDAPGHDVDDKRVVFDIRVVLDDGTRVVVEMQRRGHLAFDARLSFYVARNHADQLCPGDDYGRLAPSVVVAWLVDPILESPERLHSVFELRERDDHTVFDERISLHILQLSGTLSPTATGHEATVQRWARFFSARDDVEFDRLASEDPIMATAVQALDELSQDPKIRDMAHKRFYDIWFHELNIRLNRSEARNEGRTEGKVELLLRQLGRRFGPLPGEVADRVRRASADRLDAWADRVLTARTLDEVLGS